MANNIITLRNAGSNIDSMINILAILYSVFKSDSFDLKDLTKVATEEKLMSSNGRIGEEARERSYNKNVSLDSIPMQFKAYAEIFRLLGWLRSENDKKRTTYRITYIGKHIVQKPTPYSLVEQSFLGIELPNNAVIRDCVNEVKLLWCYLRAIKYLNNKATKHELLFVCHFIKDDKCISEFNDRISKVLVSRQKKSHSKNLKDELVKLCESAKPKPITLNTLENSTRITLSALKFDRFNWVESYKNTYSLTTYGLSLVESYKKYFKPRLSNIVDYDVETLEALSIIGLTNIFIRSNFDTDELKENYDYGENLKLLKSKSIIDNYTDANIWFSPYQILSPSKIVEIFGSRTESNHQNKGSSKPTFKDQDSIAYPISSPVNISYLEPIITNSPVHITYDENSFVAKIKYFLDIEQDTDKTIEKIHDHYQQSNKDDYYPLVAEAFGALGFDCKVERHGQNSLRWDAIIIDGERSIPIEIKSPTEEEFISVKAIRQALENRIIRCARYSSKDQIGISSYVVGFNYPSARAEVNELIDYINKAFNIKIALFSLDTLTSLVIRSLQEQKVPDRESFFSLHGNVELI